MENKKILSLNLNSAEVEQLQRFCADGVSMSAVLSAAISAFVENPDEWSDAFVSERKALYFMIDKNKIQPIQDLQKKYDVAVSRAYRLFVQYVLAVGNIDFLQKYDSVLFKQKRAKSDTVFRKVYVSAADCERFASICKAANDLSVMHAMDIFTQVLYDNLNTLEQFLDSASDVPAGLNAFFNKMFGFRITILETMMARYNNLSCRYRCKIDLSLYEQLSSVCENRSISMLGVTRSILIYAMNHDKIDKIDKIQADKSLDAVTEALSQPILEQDTYVRLSVRVAKKERENFQEYCLSKNVTASTLLILFIDAIERNPSWAAEILKTLPSKSGLDSKMSVRVRVSDRDKLIAICSALGMNYSLLVRAFISYCFTNSFDYTRLMR